MAEEQRLIEVMARSKSGHIQPFRVLEILSIDGKPYLAESTADSLQQCLNQIHDRLTTIEHVLQSAVETSEGESNG